MNAIHEKEPPMSDTKNRRWLIGRWIDRFLGHTHAHYACFLPGRVGILSTLMLKLFYCGIKVSRSQSAGLQALPHEAIIVLAAQSKSYFEYLFYHTRYQQEGLPFPEIGFDHPVIFWQRLKRILKIALASLDFLLQNRHRRNPYADGYIRDRLEAGHAGFLALTEKRGFYRRFVKKKTDPVRFLIEMQQSLDRPIVIVPQIMFFGTDPYRATPSLVDVIFGSEQQPGNLRRLVTLFKNPGKVFVEISEPINIRTFLTQAGREGQTLDSLTTDLRRHLMLRSNRHRQSITGPALKSMEEVKEDILTQSRLRTFMRQHAQKRNLPLHQIHKEADACIDEIAAKYSPAVVRVSASVVGWVLKSIFEDVVVDPAMIERVRNMSRKGPLILIPCHKSHIDYLILSYLLYRNNMPCPHVAAGKNLSFWPMGPIFRSGGAFFIRRTFKGAVLYAKVFAEYIHKLLAEGFNIEFFIEGGRSRTGKLILPKLGLLSILLNAYKSGACEDMILAPIYIGYDRVLEEKAYVSEIEGGQKQQENFLQVIKARKFLKKRSGKIYVQFHEPISLNQLLEHNDLSLAQMSTKEQNALCRNLGHRVINAINQVTVVTPHALVAAALLNCTKKRFSQTHLMTLVETYLTYLLGQRAKLSDTLMLNFVSAVEQVLQDYGQQKHIDIGTLIAGGPSTDLPITINTAKRPNLEYYKNNCINFFIPGAFTALTILSNDAFQFSAADLHPGYSWLQEFYKNEFAYDVERSPEYFVRKNIKAFIDQAILIPHPTLPDTYNLTAAGFRKLNFFSRFLKTYFESYWIVLKTFMRHPQKRLDAKERLKRIQTTGARMYKRKEVERIEALSKINYDNAAAYYLAHGIKGSEDQQAIDTYAGRIRHYLNHL